MDHLPFLGAVLRAAAAAVPPPPGGQGAAGKPGEPGQVVTAADLMIEDLLRARIHETHPGHGVLGEENGRTGASARELWVLDPIDGTANYAAGSPLFGIMLGLLVEGEPVAGGVALPAFGEIYLAQRGRGAFRNGKPLRTPAGGPLGSSLIAYGIDGETGYAGEDFAFAAVLAARCRGLRMSNSVFDLMQVATGGYGACLNRTTRIWDNVAPQVILEEAGCVYTGFGGAPVTYEPLDTTIGATFTVCAAAPAVHPVLQQAIRELSAGTAR